MGKLRFSSLFHSRDSSSSPSADADIKKQNRRSFSVLSHSLRQKDVETNGAAAAPAPKPTKADKAETPSSDQSTSRMIALARKITQATEKLESHMKANNLPLPSFDVDSPADFPSLPEDVQRSRQDIIHATKELSLLAHGPRESVRWGIWEVSALQLRPETRDIDNRPSSSTFWRSLPSTTTGLVSLDGRRPRLVPLLTHAAAKLVPIDSTITLAELQTKTPLDPINLARVLRMAMTNGIFREPSPGVIAHTAQSRVLAEDENLQAWVGFNGEDIFPSAGHVIQALNAHPEATSLTRAGFQFAFNTVDKEPMFATFGKDPARARRMGRAMASLTGGEGYEPSFFVDVDQGGYDFSAIDATSGTFVDVGGSHGFICVDLASRYKNMKFVVQDLQKTVDSAPKPVHADPQVADRITLLAHDFFTEQVTKDADGTPSLLFFPPAQAPNTDLKKYTTSAGSSTTTPPPTPSAS